MNLLVPSRGMFSGRDALRRVLRGAERLDVAVAFVSPSGVQVLRELFLECGTPSEFRIIVRGGPVSDPDAVVALSESGAEVRVVMGARAPLFHPKLWIGSSTGSTRVLSGSGNLTRGGLDRNYEQFELLDLQLPESEPMVAAHQQRWAAFFALGSPLSDAIESPAWKEWVTQQTRRRQLTEELKRLDRRLADSEAPSPVGGGLNSLERVLQEAVGDQYATQVSRRSWGERVEVDVGDDRAFKYLFLTYGHPDEGETESPAIDLLIYPGDTLRQARRFYSRMNEDTRDRILELAASPGWAVRPNFHFGFWSRGVLHDDKEPPDLAGYLDYWRSHIDDHRRRPAEAWPAILDSLARHRVVSPQYPRRFVQEVGRQSPCSPAPAC